MHAEGVSQLQKFIEEIPGYFGECPCAADIETLFAQYSAFGILHETILATCEQMQLCRQQVVPMLAMAVSMVLCRTMTYENNNLVETGKLNELEASALNHHIFVDQLKAKLDALDLRLQRMTMSCTKN